MDEEKKSFDYKYIIIATLSLMTVVILSIAIADYRTDKLEQDFSSKLTTLESDFKERMQLKDEIMDNIYNDYQRVTDENDKLRSIQNQPVLENKVDIKAVNNAINTTTAMLLAINETKQTMICAGKTYSVKINGKYYCVRRSTGSSSGSSASVS